MEDALKIKEAKNGEIILTEVSSKGATALIPVPDTADIYRVEVFIEDVQVAEKKELEPAGEYYEVSVPKDHLQTYVTRKVAFTYTLYDVYDNQWGPSEPVSYLIRQS
ncbi:hypothetical protein [Pseudomonas sp. DR48]|uniref:hypothetical protein n=1 Tax=Pseudomonas sp. DR48 TaxID=2871095 RepID=UPI001C99A82A|nr:hypothetical protein [Pseudomonas sp. DR48]QZP32145.1 hypothetical protein K5K95_28960 [Pseudomonas sp. DR48]